MSLRIKLRRATESQLSSAASSSLLLQGEPYVLTDVEKLAIGTSANTYFIVGGGGGSGGLGETFIANFNTTTSLTGLPTAVNTFIDSIISNVTTHNLFKVDVTIILKGVSGSNNYSYVLNATTTVVRSASPRSAVGDLKIISYSGVRIQTGTSTPDFITLSAEHLTLESYIIANSTNLRFNIKHSMPGTTASLPSQVILNIYTF